ncbi:MAG: NAD(P)/FAD-dependent oxidoreductase [Candidatus Methylacidiphilales bacterium]|nr:NAD(P)/FAD-dependent oxidoreductase [Candidatus Methylacidiphilales bacterium]
MPSSVPRPSASARPAVDKPSPDGWDLIVIGGGAAGFFGALSFAATRQDKQARTLILEKSPRTLAKVAVSGGGRCNVTHHCFEPRELVKHYPRGGRALIGAFTRWQPRDTVDWFEARGVRLKTEDDGRMFPLTDHSQTIIDCLEGEARRLGVEVRTGCGAERLEQTGGGFAVHTPAGILHAARVLVASGGTRSGETLASALGHVIIPPAPSLFSFHIRNPLLEGLAGLSMARVAASVPETGLRQQGALLVTHNGLSGPAILRLSAWGARWMQEQNYHFPVKIDWLPDHGPDALAERFRQVRAEWNRKQVGTLSPFPEIPQRLWERLAACSLNWSEWSRESEKILTDRLKQTTLSVAGKSMNKEEFVTAGGVDLAGVDLRTMESRTVPGLYFAGEALDIDGVTGGFNFQAAWTTGYLAGTAAARAG